LADRGRGAARHGHGLTCESQKQGEAKGKVWSQAARHA
jgi:hypothetical protein